jgi:hypothetical protein
MCRLLQQESPQQKKCWTFEVNPRLVLGTVRIPKVRKKQAKGKRKDKGKTKTSKRSKDNVKKTDILKEKKLI